MQMEPRRARRGTPLHLPGACALEASCNAADPGSASHVPLLPACCNCGDVLPAMTGRILTVVRHRVARGIFFDAVHRVAAVAQIFHVRHENREARLWTRGSANR